MINRYVALLLCSATLYLQACNTKTSENNSNAAKDTIESANSANSTAAQSAAATDQAGLENYWNNINFSDTATILSPDYGEQKFVDFINVFPRYNAEQIATAIDSLIQKSSIEPKVQSYFEELLNRYLYDINSPFYNESYYTIALESLLKSKAVSADSKKKYKILLQLASRNNLGNVATDFSYTTSSGEHTLLKSSNKYIVLFFYEPGCSSCAEHIKTLKPLAAFNQLIANNIIDMLAIYPDGNKAIWESFKENIPSNWINGIDSKQTILKKGLYDLKASPTIYLLDRDKKVILKDTNLNTLLSYLGNLK